MTNDESRQLVRSVLRQVAPEADIDEVGTGETLQEALDLDSIDFLNFVVGLQEETGFEIPERDYPKLSTVEGCTAYLTSIDSRP
ncbi:MAG TPA: acyl carrier protein [Acidimicrobiales bacterium]|nr:acyl carrier protein [Acidimicrobiales bacterium]